MKEREKRSCNLMIFGVKEKFDGDSEGDLNKAKSILTGLDKDAGKPIVGVYRVGKPETAKVRPLRVTFSLSSEVKQILRVKNNIKEQGIYIKSDQTPMQRAYLKALLEELEERKKKDESELIVKYINNIPKIVKKHEHSMSTKK